MTWQTERLNADPTNPAAVRQVKLEGKVYSQDSEKFHKSAYQYKKSELQDSVNAAALTSDEQQLWNQFQSTLTAKCKTACGNYRTTPTFANFPGVTDDFKNLDPINPAAVLEAKFYAKEAVSANIGPFKLLEQGCLYEFLNVLLTKRNDTDSALSSFNQLQDKLNQFLSNVDVNNHIALLEAQVDMLAYEKGIAAAPVISAPTPAVK